MTNFYEARDSENVTRWIAAHEQTGENRMFVWLPNTERWHHNAALEEVFYSLAPDMTFHSITAAEAAAATLIQPKLDRKSAGWIVDELANLPESEILLSTELGLPRAPAARPTTNSQVIADLAKGGEWVRVKVYSLQNLPKGQALKAARTLASEIRTGKRKKLAQLGHLEARTRDENNEIVVEAKRVGRSRVTLVTGYRQYAAPTKNTSAVRGVVRKKPV